jgi:O-antigen ligase
MRSRSFLFVAVTLLLVSANAPFQVLADRGGPFWRTWSQPAIQLVQFLCVAVAASRAKLLKSVVRNLWPFYALCVWLVISSLYSVNQAASAAWVVGTLPKFLVFGVICAELDLKWRVLVIHLSLVVSFAIAYVAGRNYSGIAYHGSTYAGLFLHGNFAAHGAALGVITGVLLIMTDFRFFVLTPGVFFCLWAAKSTGSDTPLAAVAFSVGVAVTWFVVTRTLSSSRLTKESIAKRWAAGSVSGLGAAALLGILAVVATRNTSLFSSADSTDVTLSGRTTIWRAVWPSIVRAPFTGYGAGIAPFTSPSLSVEYNTRAGFDVPHAHNGFVDSLLVGGFPALFLLLLIIGYGLRRVFSTAAKDPVGSTLRVGLIIGAISLNITEPDFLQTMLPTTFALLAAASPTSRMRIGNRTVDGLEHQPISKSRTENRSIDRIEALA